MNLSLDLEKHDSFLEKIKTSLACYSFYILWAYVIYHIIYFFIPEAKILQIPNYSPFSRPSDLRIFFENCIVAPITEELFWRFGVGIILLKIGLSRYNTFSILLLLSLSFGYFHGSTLNCFTQGVLGMFLANSERSASVIAFLSE